MPKGKSAAIILCCLLIAGAGLAAEKSVAPVAGTDAISIPQLINYQGYLTDAGGTALNGNYDMTYAIYDVATGGTAVWTETQTGVAVTDGVFNVILGSVTAITGIPDGPDCYLEITVGTEVIAPRVRLVSVPYSYGADMAADAEMLGGVPAASYAIQSWVTANDWGRSGVAANLYEGSATLSSKYALISHPHAASDITSGIFTVARGGTGLGTVGSNGMVLTVVSGAPAWQTPSTGVTGSGTSGYNARWTGTTTLGNGAMQDNGTYVSVGTSPTTGRMIYGYTTTSTYYGVYGSAPYYGVTGFSSSYSTHGVLGCGGSYNAGVYGYGGSYYGVYAYVNSSSSGYGAVYGYNAQYTQTGILGPVYTGSGVGYYPCGIYGTSQYDGVTGYAATGSWGTLGSGYNSCGVYGYSTGSYAAGYFYNANGRYARIGYSTYKVYGTGTVSTYIIDDNDMERTLHCPEAPGVVFEDYGAAQLADGHARVEIDPLLLKGITISSQYPLLVYVTPTGTEPVALSVQKDATSFDVYGPAGSNVAFDWRIVATRKGYEHLRFEAHERPASLKGTPEPTTEEVDAIVATADRGLKDIVAKPASEPTKPNPDPVETGR